MNLPKPQQRTLHALAQGGRIVLERDHKGDITAVQCLSRDGWTLSDCTVEVFRSLKRKRLIASHGGGPYRINRDGLANLRGQLDNRVGGKAW
ncbi:MAG TPA: YjhX family toxin [Phenylobacterium sp.]|uniref:YjhX family toxin n=1 Tax=Phenylobacterium sp. TaxID=1871053 RepID=UPI002C6A51DA|nr:YjhX family toxin [Phenylobacterium sp.]HSV03792.1 YjhX family toxin [Phenylobacterium sp.]